MKSREGTGGLCQELPPLCPLSPSISSAYGRVLPTFGEGKSFLDTPSQTYAEVRFGKSPKLLRLIRLTIKMN